MTSLRLPLFPLNSVLFPGLVLPLNIFEARYRAMMRDLLALPEDERRFGVVAIRDGREVAPTAPGLPDGTVRPAEGPTAGFGPDPMRAFHTVGCVADAATIREKSTKDGSGPATGGGFGTAAGPGAQGPGYEVLATGTTRFRLLSVDASGPYLVGEVEALEEIQGEGAGALASGVLRAFRTYQKRLAWANERTLSGGQDLPDEPSVLSYLVAAAAVLDVPAKQRLLQAPDTASRLTEELKLLRQEAAVIGKLPSLPAVDLTRQPTSPN
ncbi:LON peptidase substrate-binding domain-containing protein [Streptomyces sp. MST-110588]|uniref:LON peptidase substrate-binding domain-containing protein n=1 Tax=Streptomyces sp. MST-110588 TaxID=2833628 RepID=UPI001F5C747E|nr:LON peptidase substrate-binding domain-containing protein [Streptomyces sp. MST-110588]UNO42610.1 LON peptidase substrate-binding domain-containing protein [Streptomyces sp. MST-110588]